MSEELKPCPFCGESSIGYIQHLNDDTYQVRCINGECGVAPITVCCSSREHAIKVWNTRAELHNEAKK